MRDQLEEELRLLCREDADRAPASVSLLPESTPPVHHPRRRARSRWIGAAVVAASAAGIAAAALGRFPHLGPAARTGGRLRSCPGTALYQLSGRRPARRSPHRARSPRVGSRSKGPCAPSGPAVPTAPGWRWIWCRPPPAWIVDSRSRWSGCHRRHREPSPPSNFAEDPPPIFGSGTRLLVSGAHRWDRRTADYLLAWTCCFTRYYDQATAINWRPARV